jgi:hypothetical protein
MPRIRSARIHALTAIVLAAPITAETLTVDDDGPADFDSIQAAVDFASDGDVVLVAPGTYTSTDDQVVDLEGKRILLSSAIPGTAIIDGESFRRGVRCRNGETAKTVIEGFVIRNCRATWYDWNDNGAIDFWEYFGGGFWNRDGSGPTIQNCIFEGNHAEYGGAILNGDEHGSICRPTIVDCAFLDNGSSACLGGAIYNWGAEPAITGCDFVENRGFFGGAILNFDGSRPEFEGCLFRGNTCASDGGAMYNDASSPILRDCVMDGNAAGDEGGAVFNADPGSSTAIPEFIDCDFIGNTANGEGGAMHNFSISPVLDGCSLRENVASSGGGVYSWNGSLPVLRDTLACGNTPGQVSGPWSDEGGNQIVPECGIDCPTDLDGDGVTGGGDLGLLFVSWGSCQDCPADFNADGLVNGKDLGLLFVRWGPCD